MNKVFRRVRNDQCCDPYWLILQVKINKYFLRSIITIFRPIKVIFFYNKKERVITLIKKKMGQLQFKSLKEEIYSGKMRPYIQEFLEIYKNRPIVDNNGE